MPYKNLSELPKPVKNALPTSAQEIYIAAYNNALEEYEDPEKRRDNESKEEVARKVAWAAVKHKYTKGEEDRWHPKEN